MIRPEHIELFELLWSRYPDCGEPPTNVSVAQINSTFSIELPGSMISFAEQCPTYGSLLASLGEDVDHSMHILSLNWSAHRGDGDCILPEWLLMINHGHDGHCFGIDKRAFDETSREYTIRYWDIDKGLGFHTDLEFPDFPSYLEYELFGVAQFHLENKNRRGRVRTQSRSFVPKIESILERLWA